MSEFSAPQLLTSLQSWLPASAARLCLALSGGVDSVVLLHALAELREVQQWRLRAVHVDHQLHVASSAWAAACKQWAQQLDIDCKVLRVQVSETAALGVEAAARNARYAALRAELQPDEVLLTAHHADDQLETILLALLRGAGVAGLAAMPACARFGAGWHLRPLLSFTREELQAWAAARQLPFVDDPSNANSRFDRNYLRHAVIPTLKTRWPAAARTASRSAAHLAEAQALLTEYVMQDYLPAAANSSLDVAVLRSLSAPRRHAVLRHWLQQHAVLMPATRILYALEHDILQAAEDRVPCTRWPEVAVYRYRNRLYLERGHHEWRADELTRELTWPWREELLLPAPLGSLWTNVTDTSNAELRSEHIAAVRPIAIARLPTALTIRFRHGGERIRLPGEPQRRQLKKLLQDSAVLPWWRDRLPLIYAAEELVAVADLWTSAEFAAQAGEPSVTLCWRNRPSIVA